MRHVHELFYTHNNRLPPPFRGMCVVRNLLSAACYYSAARCVGPQTENRMAALCIRNCGGQPRVSCSIRTGVHGALLTSRTTRESCRTGTCFPCVSGARAGFGSRRRRIMDFPSYWTQTDTDRRTHTLANCSTEWPDYSQFEHYSQSVRSTIVNVCGELNRIAEATPAMCVRPIAHTLRNTL